MRKGYHTPTPDGPGILLSAARGLIQSTFVVLLSCWLAAGCSESPPTTQAAEDKTNTEIHSSLPAPRDPEPDPPEVFVEPGAKLPGRTHWVQKGETLYSISRLYYGTENQWRKIYYANDRRLRHPDELPVGIKLIIP